MREEVGNTRVSVIAVVAILVGYWVVGYAVYPFLLAPLGRDPEPLAYGPSAAINISYSHSTGDLTVTEQAGDTFTATETNRVEIRITPLDGPDTVYLWSDVGGTYPIQPGDSVTISNATVDGRSLASGDIVRVVWYGPNTGQGPVYCPYRGEETLDATLANWPIEEPG